MAVVTELVKIVTVAFCVTEVIVTMAAVVDVEMKFEQGPNSPDSVRLYPGPQVTHGVAALESLSKVPAAHTCEEHDPAVPSAT